MEFKYLFVLFVIYQVFQMVKCEYNFTFAMAHQCKTHTSNLGYYYDTFYAVDNKRKLADDLVFEMHLAILAPSDGHIMLSSIPNPPRTAAVYEIVVGAGANTYTEIRRMRKYMSTGTKNTPKILSPTEFRAFWIKVTIDGVVEFGHEGEELPIISYTDVSPVPIKFFSFATWNGVEARYLYDCPAAGENLTEETSNSQIVEPPRTPTEKLKKLIIDSGSRHAPSQNGRTSIHIKAAAAAVRYDARLGEFKCRLSLVMGWILENIEWDPKHYNGTSHVRFSPGEIWQPDLMVHNSVGFGLLESSDSEPIIVMSSGLVVSYTRSIVTTMCQPDRGHKNWPHDEYICRLEIGPWVMEQFIEIISTNASFDDNDIHHPNYTLGWDVISEHAKTSYHNRSPYRTENISASAEDAMDMPDTMLILTIRIRRKYSSLKFVIYSPLYTVLLVILLSFILPPQSEYRRGMYCGAFVVLCGVLGHLGSTVPTQTTSIILELYVLAIFSIAACVLLQSLLSQSWIKRLSTCDAIEKMLRSRVLRALLGLKPLTTCRTYNYIPGEGLSEVDQEHQEEEPTFNAEEELVLVIDRIMFGCCTILYFSMMVIHS